MRYLILGLLFSVNVWAMSQPQGGGTTWPFGKEIGFPWTKISGIWQAKLGPDKEEVETYFIFKVGKDTILPGEKYVKVTQYDPSTCTVIARGPATLAAGSDNSFVKRRKYIEGKIKGMQGEFKISVHAFRESDVKIASNYLVTDTTSTIMVLKLRAPGASEKDALNSQLIKVSDRTEPVCD